MKVAEIEVGKPYAYVRKYRLGEMVYLLSKQMYAEMRGSAGGGIEPYTRNGKKNFWVNKSGYLIMKVRRPDLLTEDDRKLLASVTAGDVLATGELYVGAKHGLSSDETGVTVEIGQTRHFEAEWDAYCKAQAEQNRVEREYRAERKRRTEENYPRMSEVARVLGLLNENYYPVYQGSENDSLRVKLEDLEALVEIAKHAVPAWRKKDELPGMDPL
jgi:hypothetical protein